MTGTIEADFFAPLPLPAALYGVLVFPFIWGLTEQMTYNGYLVPRLQVLFRSTFLAVACGVRLVVSARRDAVGLRHEVHVVPDAVAGAVLGVPNAVVSTYSPIDSVRDRACAAGWCQRVHRRRASAPWLTP
jgi:hypothetical protein